jgi:hypothetical protein
VAQFTAAEANLLDEYLRQGGGLVFFLGDQVQADNYNRQLGGLEGGPRVLPARLGEAVGEGKYRFDPLAYAHPLIESFRDQEQAGLLTTLVTNYIRLTPQDSTARVALAFQGGDPAIVEESLSGGRSVLVATSADTSWTSMPIWPSYVPVVQELLTYSLGAESRDRNVRVGQSLAGVLSSTGQPAMIRLPSGERKAAEIKDRGSSADWNFADTFASGVYALEPSEANPRESLYAVNVDTAESDLTPITPEELKGVVWPGITFTHHTSWQNLDERPATEVTRQSKVHVWLLYGVLGLLFVETFLAWQFGHHHR